MAFLNREKELATLQRLYDSDHAELLVLYGRRRTGKSELLKNFCSEKRHVYFVADRTAESDQLALFSEQIYALTGDPVIQAQPFTNWGALFAYLGAEAAKQHLVVAIDEFQYLCQTNPALPSILQRFWDMYGKQTMLFLILCGSYVGFMEDEVLGYQSPLYGRRTAQILLEPFDYLRSSLFAPRYSASDNIRLHSILGGMPAYLALFDDSLTIADNIRKNMLEESSFLYREARFLLMEELREPRRYYSIVRAIASGRAKLNEIAQNAGVSTATVGAYLDVLRDLGFIEREVPVSEERPEKSRRGIYRLKDNYLCFWFRFILPAESYLGFGRSEYVLSHKILPYLDEYVSQRFEKVCQECLASLAGADLLPVAFSRLGSWWDAREQVDIVAMEGPQPVLLGECKWSLQPVDFYVLNSLRRRAAHMGAPQNVRYALFSLSGFTSRLRAAAGEEGVLLFTPDDMFQAGRMISD